VWTVVHDHLGGSESGKNNQKRNRALYVQSYERKLILRFCFKDYEKVPAVMECGEIDDKDRWGYWVNVPPSQA
jgi:hypothetical protein